MENVVKAVGGGSCWVQMPLKLALGVKETVIWHRQGALERGRGGGLPPALPIHPCPALLLPFSRGRGFGFYVTLVPHAASFPCAGAVMFRRCYGRMHNTPTTTTTTQPPNNHHTIIKKQPPTTEQPPATTTQPPNNHHTTTTQPHYTQPPHNHHQPPPPPHNRHTTTTTAKQPAHNHHTTSTSHAHEHSQAFPPHRRACTRKHRAFRRPAVGEGMPLPVPPPHESLDAGDIMEEPDVFLRTKNVLTTLGTPEPSLLSVTSSALRS